MPRRDPCENLASLKARDLEQSVNVRGDTKAGAANDHPVCVDKGFNLSRHNRFIRIVSNNPSGKRDASWKVEGHDAGSCLMHVNDSLIADANTWGHRDHRQ